MIIYTLVDISRTIEKRLATIHSNNKKILDKNKNF